MSSTWRCGKTSPANGKNHKSSDSDKELWCFNTDRHGLIPLENLVTAFCSALLPETIATLNNVFYTGDSSLTALCILFVGEYAMKIASIMTKRVATVEMDDSLRTINAIFCSAKFHHLLVVEDDELVGIISDRDLLKATSPFYDTAAERPQDAARWERKAHQIMTRSPVTVAPETSLKTATQLLLKKNVSCLPILSADGKIEGIVTWKDLVRTYMGLQGEIKLTCGHCKTPL